MVGGLGVILKLREVIVALYSLESLRTAAGE